MMKNYVPDVCLLKECAYPNLQCAKCLSNKSLCVKNGYVVKDPKGHYIWLKKMSGH